jgi:hypothetical protein
MANPRAAFGFASEILGSSGAFCAPRGLGVVIPMARAGQDARRLVVSGSVHRCMGVCRGSGGRPVARPGSGNCRLARLGVVRVGLGRRWRDGGGAIGDRRPCRAGQPFRGPAIAPVAGSPMARGDFDCGRRGSSGIGLLGSGSTQGVVRPCRCDIRGRCARWICRGDRRSEAACKPPERAPSPRLGRPRSVARQDLRGESAVGPARDVGAPGGRVRLDAVSERNTGPQSHSFG